MKETISKISSEAATSEVVVPVPKKLSQTHLSKRNNDDDDDNLVGEQSSEQLMDETRAKTNGMLLVNGKQHTTTATSMVNGVSVQFNSLWANYLECLNYYVDDDDDNNNNNHDDVSPSHRARPRRARHSARYATRMFTTWSRSRQ